MSEEIQGFRFRASARVAHGEKVRLRFDRAGTPMLAVCSDLSMEGMFVATHDLRPLGTVVEFEIEGREDEVARGLGDVVWARKEKLGPGRHAGMGLQFRYVDPRSREVIAELVDRRRHEDQQEQQEQQEAPGHSRGAGPPPSGDVGGPMVSDKSLAGVAGGLVAPAAAREVRLADEVVLAGRGGAAARAPRAAAPRLAPVALDGGERARPSRGGFPWLWVVLILLLLGAGAAAWWIWLSDRAASAPMTSAPTPATSVPTQSAVPSGPAGTPAPPVATSAPVEVLSVSLAENDASSALVAIELTRVPGGGGVRVSRLESPARLLVRIPEADRVPEADLELGTRLVTGLRAAVHLAQGGSELHLVFDLAGDAVRVESRFEGTRLLLRLSNG